MNAIQVTLNEGLLSRHDSEEAQAELRSGIQEITFVQYLNTYAGLGGQFVGWADQAAWPSELTEQ
jgi:hypothetical protein